MIDRNLVEEVAQQLGGSVDRIDPAFIEKDWYAQRAMRHLAEYVARPEVPYTLVFGGGTSLSKAHGLTRRFSEDLDFLAVHKGESRLAGRPLRNERRAFRNGIVERLNADGELQLPPGNVHAHSGSFELHTLYPAQFGHPALRKHVKLEVTFGRPLLSTDERRVESLIAGAGGAGDALMVPTVDAVETAGHKLSALSWRPFAHADGQVKVDVTFVRHVYDLGALAEVSAARPDALVAATTAGLEQNTERRYWTRDPGPSLSIEDRFSGALALLRTPYYDDAYTRYVDSMSYAPRSERLGYEATLARVSELVRVVTDPRHLPRQDPGDLDSPKVG